MLEIQGGLRMANRFGKYFTLFLAACGGGGDDGGDDAPPDRVLSRASRSSTIALSNDGARVVMVNPEDDSISVFQTADNLRTAKVTTGDEPSNVVLAPDSTTGYVANRADATVVKLTGLDTASPAMSSIDVGSEPVGLALSPTGARLFVAEMAEGRVSVIDTASMTITGSIDAPLVPRALLVTNDGDADDNDETLIVPEYFGEPTPGGEARDDGRRGLVRRYSLADLAPTGGITLLPTDSGFPRGGVAGNPNVTTSPNQLAAVAIADGRIYLTSVSASPEGPPRFDNNVFPVVYVADLAGGTEVTTRGGTTNLARKIVDALPAPTPDAPRFLPGDLSDLDFVPGTRVSYAVGKAGDVMQRVVWNDDDVTVGSTQNTQIDLAGDDTRGRCQNPIGVVMNDDASRAYVNCWVTRRLGVVDLTSQSLLTTIEASAAPQTPAEQAAQRGRRFYFTGRGRWSNAGGNGARGGEGWSSCGSCHPDGLTDNMTWVFAAGPRQTTSQDGSFSHGPGPQKQRIFNWTAVFEEHHDFERNTRDVSGGLGAITTAATLADCNQLDKETQVPLAPGGTPIGGLAQPLEELADDPAVALCGHKDWDDIDTFVKSIRPPRAVTTVDPAAVARGRDLFEDGGCAKCHGGAGWTVSRRYWSPTGTTNGLLANADFDIPPFFPTTWSYRDGANDRKQISGQPIIASPDVTGPAEPTAIGIGQVACSLRNVGTFGAPGDTVATDALEKRPFMGMLVRAQGRAGYNVPSLYGLALGAPYLHHGQAATLDELFDDPRWQFHTNAGNANFSVLIADDAARADLVTFLLSIDGSEPEFAIPLDAGGDDFDACPDAFP
jgi:DNA-binding beta-propeller fold protein YncE